MKEQPNVWWLLLHNDRKSQYQMSLWMPVICCVHSHSLCAQIEKPWEACESQLTQRPLHIFYNNKPKSDCNRFLHYIGKCCTPWNQIFLVFSPGLGNHFILLRLILGSWSTVKLCLMDPILIFDISCENKECALCVDMKVGCVLTVC